MLPDRPGDAPGRRHDRVLHASTCRAGTRSRSAATTSARPARRPPRSWPSRSRTASPTSSRRSRAASTWTTSRRGCRFFFNAHIDFFEEIAKYRAARRIWARELRDTFGARDERSLLMRFHTPDGGRVADRPAAAQQHRAHDDRGAGRRCSAAPSRCTPTPSTRRWRCRPRRPCGVALRTQQVIAHETGVTNTIDPLGGCYFVEALTDADGAPGLRLLRQDRRARRHGRGGQAATTRSARSPTPPSATSRRSSAGERVIVGVNALRAGRRRPTRAPAHRPGARAQADRPRSRPSARARDAAAVEAALGRLRERRGRGAAT